MNSKECPGSAGPRKFLLHPPLLLRMLNNAGYELLPWAWSGSSYIEVEHPDQMIFFIIQWLNLKRSADSLIMMDEGP